MNALPSLEIKGFRGFRDLTIPRVGRVNLVVGKNNVGKSSLLEALRLYASRGARSVIQSLLLSREELAARRTPSGSAPSSETGWEDLFAMFRLHHNPTFSPPPIFIGPVGTGPALTMELCWYVALADFPSGKIGWHLAHGVPDDPFDSGRPAWVAQFGEAGKHTVFLDVLTQHRFFGHQESITVQHIPVDGLNSVQLGRLYDRAAVADQIDPVLSALRLIAPDVEQILLVGERLSRRVLLRVRDKAEPVPLKSMGDGMTRILGIILALVNAQGGMLLIDEIENGIHYSVMSELWHLILQVAAKSNVQVFATSHSWDCLEGFQKAATADKQNLAMLIRLEKRKGGIQAVLFDEEDLAVVTRERIEVR